MAFIMVCKVPAYTRSCDHSSDYTRSDFYVREYLAPKYSSSQISWIGSFQLMIVMSIGLITGRGFDIGYFWHLMIGGSVLFVFCLFMLSLSQPGQYYQIFLAQGVGLGMAIGATYIPGLGIVSHYFKRRRALALGIAASGSAVGGTLHPIMLNQWFHGSLGFHNGVRASAGFNAGLLVIALSMMKLRLPPAPRRASFRILLSFFHDTPYMFTVIGTFFNLLGLYFPFFFLQLNAVINGVDEKLAFYVLAMLNGGSMFGRIVPNFFVHKFGPFNAIIPCIAICSLLIFCTLAIKDAAGTIVFALLYGFFSGGYVGVIAPLVGSLAQSDAEIGARLGLCFTFTGIGALIGSPIAGALLTTEYRWWRPILFSGLSVATGAVLFSISRFLVSRRKGTQLL
ncbi:hypothetical protein AX16_007149 [Volvariella volvacea WC 439]|nr:hypothetical protein AX16_007149 [Volvariella volvacea WC 439]